MRPGRRRSDRAAFACTMTIMIAGVLLLLVVLLGRHGVHEIARQRSALLATQADLVLQSARDWSDTHSEQLRAAGAVELPLAGLLPAMATGRLELGYAESSDGLLLIECRLKITQGQRSVARHAYWPARSGT